MSHIRPRTKQLSYPIEGEEIEEDYESEEEQPKCQITYEPYCPQDKHEFEETNSFERGWEYKMVYDYFHRDEEKESDDQACYSSDNDYGFQRESSISQAVSVENTRQELITPSTSKAMNELAVNSKIEELILEKKFSELSLKPVCVHTNVQVIENNQTSLESANTEPAIEEAESLNASKEQELNFRKKASLKPAHVHPLMDLVSECYENCECGMEVKESDSLESADSLIEEAIDPLSVDQQSNASVYSEPRDKPVGLENVHPQSSTSANSELNEQIDESFQPNPTVHQFTNALKRDLLKLYESQVLSDMTINCKGQKFLVHKSILATRTTFFQLNSEENVSEDNYYKEHNFDADAFNLFLKYVYTGSIDLSADLIEDVFDLSVKYNVPCLTQICQSEMAKNMNAKIAMKFLILAKKKELAEMVRSSKDFVKRKVTFSKKNNIYFY